MKRKFLILILGSAIFTAAHAQMGNPLKQGMPNTVTLPNGQVIYDLSGQWDLIFEVTNTSRVGEDIIKIEQKGNEIVGIRIIGTIYNPKGSTAIRGELEKDEFKSLSYCTFWGWIPSTGKIGDKGNKIEIKTTLPEGENYILETTLTRK